MIKRYFVKELENGKIVLVKVLNEYSTIEEAENDLFELSTNNTTEKKILQKYEDREQL